MAMAMCVSDAQLTEAVKTCNCVRYMNIENMRSENDNYQA